MKDDEFRSLLTGFGYNEKQVDDCLSGVALLEAYLGEQATGRSLETATPTDVPGFAAQLVERHLNERNRFVGVYHYAGMVGNHDLQVGILDLLDGFEILGNLHRQVGEQLGETVQTSVFDGVELPPVGSTSLEWTRVNSIVFPRLEAAAPRDAVVRILRSGLRNLSDSRYLPIKERFEAIGDLDDFLEDRGRRHLETLREHRDNGTPYFNQFIDDRVLEFVANTPEIGRGVRQGRTIVEIKIPHQAIEYLSTSNRARKQYHVCHCPVVKESMNHPDLPMSPTFCEFCPTFNAKPWEVIFGRKLKYDVLDSALRGGLWCKFAIHLPEAAA